MGRRKSSENIAIDELALAKSAAWAWYQHGSGSDGRPVFESDVWRAKIEPKPSRYKLEAIRNMVPKTSSNLSNTTVYYPIRPSNISLLDNYEIERISRQLDYYIKLSHAKCQRGNSGGDVAVEEVKNNNIKVVQKNKKLAKGYFRIRHVPACGGSRDDVVEYSRRRRPPEKGGVAVVDGGGCRPRPWGVRV